MGGNSYLLGSEPRVRIAADPQSEYKKGEATSVAPPSETGWDSLMQPGAGPVDPSQSGIRVEAIFTGPSQIRVVSLNPLFIQPRM